MRALLFVRFGCVRFNGVALAHLRFGYGQLLLNHLNLVTDAWFAIAPIINADGADDPFGAFCKRGFVHLAYDG